MRVAAISDPHGNLPALEAVLEDAKQQGVDYHYLLGDYYADFPYPNEMVEALRTIPGKAVAGNKEQYLREHAQTHPKDWVHTQFAALYWNFRELRPENSSYLAQLPDKVEEKLEGIFISAVHASRDVFAGTTLKEPSCSQYAERYKHPVTQGEYNVSMKQLIQEHTQFAHKRKSMTPGIYLFGHSHVQWHCEVDDFLFVNAGSCGLPLDLKNSAPYTILTLENGRYTVEPRRVAYSTEKPVTDLRASSLYTEAPIWCQLILREYHGAREQVSYFLRFASGLAEQQGLPSYPISNHIWQRAGEEWLANQAP